LRASISQRILELLRENPGASLKEISAALEAPINRVRAVLYDLKSRGYVEKAGKGYIVTERGLEYLEYLERVRRGGRPVQEEVQEEVGQATPSAPPFIEKTAEKQEAEAPREAPMQAHREEKPETGLLQTQLAELESSLLKIANRLDEFEKRLTLLERTVRDIEKALEALRKRRIEALLEPPVMPYSEALSRLGAQLERMIMEGRIVRIGSLVADPQFYHEFKSKFPIKLADLDKLSEYEKLLLEEMRKEALVVLHAGKEYRLLG
jgi:predicted transcriptional regulator